mmetsp:Transcript_1919/g.2718  ORF Transcript_1919/g.2718 Transcript_1919/m.2718 type:complete len:158 (-) Transcript_1919:1344-1817(-)
MLEVVVARNKLALLLGLAILVATGEVMEALVPQIFNWAKFSMEVLVDLLAPLVTKCPVLLVDQLCLEAIPSDILRVRLARHRGIFQGRGDPVIGDFSRLPSAVSPMLIGVDGNISSLFEVAVSLHVERAHVLYSLEVLDTLDFIQELDPVLFSLQPR